jgi:hypothetical protein
VTDSAAPSGSGGQRWAAGVLTAFGIVAVVGASQLPFGSVTRPGAGFFPLCLATALTLVSAGVLLANLGGRAAEGAVSPPSRPGGLARAATTLAALVGYALALETLGFGASTFLLVTFLFRAIEPRRWPVALAGAAITAVGCHVLFRIWLGVRLPAGPWGF